MLAEAKEGATMPRITGIRHSFIEAITLYMPRRGEGARLEPPRRAMPGRRRCAFACSRDYRFE